MRDASEATSVPSQGEMSAAKLEEMVHALTAQRLLEALSNPELCTPQMIQAALRFLTDNKVTGIPLPESNVAKVREAFKAKAPFKLAE